jgi:hypothetical protein
MNVLFEEFVAEFLRRNKRKVRLGGGEHLAEVSYQRNLGRFFDEFNMRADLVLTASTSIKRPSFLRYGSAARSLGSTTVRTAYRVEGSSHEEARSIPQPPAARPCRPRARTRVFRVP